MGRKPMGDKALTAAENMARYRERKKAAGLTRIELWQAPDNTQEPLENIDTNNELDQLKNELFTLTTDKSTLQNELTELKAAANTAKAQWETEKTALQEELKQALEKVQQAPIPKAKKGQRENPREGLMKKEYEKGYCKGILAACNLLLSKGNEGIGISKEVLSNFGITKAKVDELGITYLEQSFVHELLE
ncbi:hypothetical protein FACS1894200_03540 [Spirochaetia bacterium]|nr:hypothetical protein FACS1894200_03540 [Spirochaetia bacterium]